LTGYSYADRSDAAFVTFTQPSVQMSGLCTHKRYEHKDASRQAEKVIKSQIVYQ